jgi:hypothetical protein
MTSGGFDEREQAFENKFKLDEELRFRVHSKAVKLFGLWIAEQLGFKDVEASVYADDVVEADFEEAGIEDVIRKVQKDLKTKGIEISDHDLHHRFNIDLEKAKKLLMQ